MAWRPHDHLIDGYIDNTVPGKVTGYLRFVGMAEIVRLNLTGDFHRDIRGTVLLITKSTSEGHAQPEDYMDNFSPVQEGDAGDITAGLPPADYVDYPYIEWYSVDCGRVVLELEPHEIEVIGTPLYVGTQEPIDRQKQQAHLARFLANVSRSLATSDRK